eukprot:TRINITY_DN3904_c0_g4_i1.p1 TRINITY_DN3904_c0_g4~~TRINITY_DN3904_c0_g4_i1.p1  ORF type:complete len:651 (+),score=131.72 TRINITY_DN3904_c0_g4_i1:58-2010(+)
MCDDSNISSQVVLEDDVLRLIFGLLSISDLGRVAQVCKNFRDVTHEDDSWKHIIQQRWVEADGGGFHHLDGLGYRQYVLGRLCLGSNAYATHEDAANYARRWRHYERARPVRPNFVVSNNWKVLLQGFVSGRDSVRALRWADRRLQLPYEGERGTWEAHFHSGSLKCDRRLCIKNEGLIFALHMLKNNPKLYVLDLVDCGITAMGCRALKEHLSQSALGRLNLKKNALTSEGLQHIAELLQNCSTLVDLNLSQCGVSDQDLVNLSVGLQAYERRHVCLCKNPLTGGAGKTLSGILRRSRRLHLSGCNLGPQGTAELALGVHGRVHHICLKDSQCGTEGVIALAQALLARDADACAGQSLTLDLRSCGLEQQAITALVPLLRGTNLQSVMLQDNRLSEAAIMTLISVVGRRSDLMVNASGNTVGFTDRCIMRSHELSANLLVEIKPEEWCSRLVPVPAFATFNSKTKRLTLDRLHLSTRLARFVNDVEMLAPKLEVLQLRWSQLKAADISQLERLLSLVPMLKVLDLGNGMVLEDKEANKLDDSAACAIAAHVALHSNLTDVNLSGNDIGDEGARALAAVLPALWFLDLSGNKIGAAGGTDLVEAWRVARPQPRLRLLFNPLPTALYRALRLGEEDTEAKVFSMELSTENS